MELIMEPNNDYQRYLSAQKKVKEIKEFYASLIPFVLVNSGLIFINLRFSPSHLWFFYPLCGWALGVFFHAMKVFNFTPFFNKEWEEKKIEEFMKQEQSNNKRNEYY